MSLFGSIQMGGNTLRSMQVGLQVVGNNIANANTPGFVRQQVVYEPAPVQKFGNLQLGLGVQIDGIVQVVDQFVRDRLVGARADRAGAEIQEKAYQDLEVLIGELSDTDLSTSLSDFFNSIDNVVQNSADVSARNLTILKGQALAQDFNRLHSRVGEVRDSLSDQVAAAGTEINDLIEEIRLLNIRITATEGGSSATSDAGALRDQRHTAVDRLSELLDIRVNEQESGGLSISLGGEFLVFEGQSRPVQVSISTENGFSSATVEFADNSSPLQTSAGELHALYSARDEVLGSFLSGLDSLAATFAFEFNKLHSQGQGLVGYSEVSSNANVFAPDDPLDEVGLTFPPINGSFDIVVRNKNTGLSSPHTIQVDLNGVDDDTSLNDLTSAIDAIDGISARVSSTGVLTIKADSQDTEFFFQADDANESGVLAALGINTFFTGSTARDLAVNSTMQDERLFAASLGGIDTDSRNAERLSAFFDTPLQNQEGSSLADLYSQLVNDVTQGSTIAQAVADGFRVFEATLEGESQAVSGVNLDEEALKMILLQRTFQAAARHIQTVSEMLDMLMDL